MKKKVLVLLADGFEEVEAITPIDYLRRAGAEVVAAGVTGAEVVGSHGLSVKTDETVRSLAATKARWTASAWDAVVVPGGMPGATNVAANAACSALLRELAAAERVVAAICAAPAIVLSPLGILAGRHFTCFPGMEVKVSGAKWSDKRVVRDGNVITSRAAGTAGEFAIAVIEALYGKSAASEVAEKVLLG